MKEISESRVVIQDSNSVKILKGIIISCIITFILLFIFAGVLTYTNIDESTIGPVVIAITGVSILVRKLHNNKFNKKKWYFKWWNNWILLHSTNIFSIKHNWKQFFIKYVFNTYDSNRNYCRNDWWCSWSKFKIKIKLKLKITKRGLQKGNKKYIIKTKGRLPVASRPVKNNKKQRRKKIMRNARSQEAVHTHTHTHTHRYILKEEKGNIKTDRLYTFLSV